MLSSILVLSTLASLAAAAPQPIVKRAVQVVSNCAVSGTAAVTFDDGPFIVSEKVSLYAKVFGCDGGKKGSCLTSASDRPPRPPPLFSSTSRLSLRASTT